MRPPTPPDELTVPLGVPRDEAAAFQLTQRQKIDVTPLPVLLGGAFPRVRGYEILSVVGTGGMGIVYEARHRELNRRVAIKTLRGEALADPEFRDRFRAEAEAIAKLQHPNVIQVFEVGTVDPVPGELYPSPFIALEFVDGGSLAQRARLPQAPRYAAATVAALARAAHAAHLLGVIHRDLKPANVLLARDGEPKIADFGIAKQLNTDGTAPPITRAGIVMGTPEYMSPEQLEGDTASPLIDVYALGVILYELLTGRVPFQGATFSETMRLTLHQEPVPPHRLKPGVPHDLETICLKCLEKTPGKRYASAEALADDLALWLDGRAIKARAVGPIGRGAKWARRNPAIAVLSVAVLLVAVTGLAGIVWNWNESRANAARAETEMVKARDAAAKERWERYRASVMAASGALRLHDTYAAERALADAPELHRDWVWGLLHAQLDRSQRVLGNGSPIEGGVFSPNGRWVLVTGPDGWLRVWDLMGHLEHGPFRDLNARGSAALSDAGTLAFTAEGHAIALFDVPTGRVRAVLRGHTAGGLFLAFTSGGGQLISTADDHTVRVWDTETGREIHLFRAPATATLPLIPSPDGRFVASRWTTSPSRIWELSTGREVSTLDGAGPVLGLIFSPKGDRIVTSDLYPRHTLRLWDVASGRLLATMKGHVNQATDIAFSPDGTRIASSSLDLTVCVWDANPTQPDAPPLFVLDGHTGSVNKIAFSPDGSRIVSSGHDRTLRYWNAATGKVVAVLHGHTASVRCASFRDDGAVIASVGADDTIRLWDVRAAENDYAIHGHTTYAYSASFFPDGARVASSAWDGTARVWDTNTGKELLKLDHGKLDVVSSVVVHPKGKVLATLARKSGESDPRAVGGVRLWDADTGALLHLWELPNHDYRDSRLSFDPTGELLAAGAPDHRVRLLNTVTRREVAVLEGHTAAVRDVAFSPNGRLLASSGEYGDGTVRVWDVATSTQVAFLGKGDPECVYSLAWNPKGTVLAAGSSNGIVRLWDTATWKLIDELKHGSDVLGLAFSPDGKLLATASRDNLIHFWSTETRQEMAELKGHKEYVHFLAFSRDGTRLVSASGDTTLRIWDTVPQRDRRPQTGLSP